MNTTHCETLHCRFTDWWVVQPRFIQNATISLVLALVVLVFAAIAQIIGDSGSEWIWHIPG